jgi:hypothetical protein
VDSYSYIILLSPTALTPSLGIAQGNPTSMDFKILSAFDHVETIAKGKSIREFERLKKYYGKGRWLKRKGTAWIALPGRVACLAEIHWYEAHGIGKKEHKIKRFLAGVKR